MSERIIELVEGMDLDLEKTFGEGTTVADLRTYAHHLDTCGCTREFMCSEKDERPNRAEVPVSTPTVCDRHMDLSNDMGALHTVIMAENRHKNHVLGFILDELPEHLKVKHDSGDGEVWYSFVKTPSFFYDNDSELHIVLHGLSHVEKATMQAKVAKQFQERRAKVVV